MRAVVITGAGGPEVLAVEERPTPEPGREQVRVRVRAAGLNRGDILQRQGRYPAPPGSPSDLPGLEFAGEVEALGAGVTGVQVGQRVYGITGGGGQAEYVVLHERALAPVPPRLDLLAAAGVPEVFMTVHDALFTQAALQIGEWVLVHAVGSGIGTAAVQLIRAAGARCIGTSRTASKLERAKALGLDVALGSEKFVEGVRDATGGTGAQVVLDTVGGPSLKATLEAMSPKGRMVVLAAQAGSEAPLPFGLLLSKRLSIRGSVLRARPLEEKIAVTQAFIRYVNPLLADGLVTPVVDRVFPMADVAAAHAYLESNASFGKVLLEI